MSSLKRIRNGSLSGLVYRFVFKLDGMWDRFNNTSERRFAYSSDRKLSLMEIQSAALAVTRFFGLEGTCYLTVFDETLSPDDDRYEVLYASIEPEDHFAFDDPDSPFTVLSQSDSLSLI